MELVPARPSNEATQLAAASLQNARFQERRQREAQSVVRNEAVFYSPVIKIDPETQNTIIQFRDNATGEVTREFSDSVQYAAYKHAVEIEESYSEPKVEKQVEEKPVIVDEEPPKAVNEKA